MHLNSGENVLPQSGEWNISISHTQSYVLTFDQSELKQSLANRENYLLTHFPSGEVIHHLFQIASRLA